MKRISFLWYLLVGRFATSKISIWLHCLLYRSSGGRMFGRLFGCKVVLLTTVGRQSGQPRTVPIFGFVNGNGIVVIASNAGKKNDPDWYLNLLKTPQAAVELDGKHMLVRGRVLADEERRRVWTEVADVYRGYGAYEASTQRTIPVVILEPR